MLVTMSNLLSNKTDHLASHFQFKTFKQNFLIKQLLSFKIAMQILRELHGNEDSFYQAMLLGSIFMTYWLQCNTNHETFKKVSNNLTSTY